MENSQKVRGIQSELADEFILNPCYTAMANHDRELALAIHVDMLTRTSGEDITLWMSGVKQLIMRL